MTIPSHTELAALARTLAYDCEADSISHALADRIAVVLNACAAALESPERVQGEARLQQECDTITELNHAQWLALGKASLLVAACNRLSAEAEEFDFDDGLGRGAQQAYWDEFESALEQATEAIDEANKTTQRIHATPPTAPAQDAQGGLGFYVEERAGVQVLQWHSGGCRPAVPTELAMWRRLATTPSPQAATAGAVQQAIDALLAERNELNEVLARIGDMAHHASTGPAVPDKLWEIRSLAYDHVILETDEPAEVAALRASTPAQQVPLTDEQRAKLLEAADHLSGDGHFMDASDAAWAADWLRGIVTKESST